MRSESGRFHIRWISGGYAIRIWRIFGRLKYLSTRGGGGGRVGERRTRQRRSINHALDVVKAAGWLRICDKICISLQMAPRWRRRGWIQLAPFFFSPAAELCVNYPPTTFADLSPPLPKTQLRAAIHKSRPGGQMQIQNLLRTHTSESVRVGEKKSAYNTQRTQTRAVQCPSKLRSIPSWKAKCATARSQCTAWQRINNFCSHWSREMSFIPANDVWSWNWH